MAEKHKDFVCRGCGKRLAWSEIYWYEGMGYCLECSPDRDDGDEEEHDGLP